MSALGPLRPPPPPPHLPLLPDGRTALPKGNPCVGCDHCCRYVTIAIPTPRSRSDFDNIRWYVLHQNVSVLMDFEGTWFVQFDTPCAWLKDGRCSHYALRPEICRDYDPSDCERYAGPADKVLIRDEADLERYLEQRFARGRRAARSTPRVAAEARTAVPRRG